MVCGACAIAWRYSLGPLNPNSRSVRIPMLLGSLKQLPPSSSSNYCQSALKEALDGAAALQKC